MGNLDNTRTSKDDIGNFCKATDKKYETWPSPKTRKRSIKRNQNNQTKSFSKADKGPITCSIINEIPTKRCRTCSASSADSLQRHSKLDLKDNRLKSNLRHHAMASFSRRSSMFDECAVEALSKEDLLVLWKRSEIELQTKLNRMLHQNSHLRQLVHVVEEHKNKTQSQNNTTSSNKTTEETCFISTRL